MRVSSNELFSTLKCRDCYELLVPQHHYSTVGCRRTGVDGPSLESFLFFTTSANLVLILQSVFESRRLACSAQTVCDDACWAGNAAETFQTVEVESFRSPSNAAEEVVFTANALCVW